VAITRVGRQLYVASDQEYRWSVLNTALTADDFRPPFILATL
jgi:hypothetical protein